LLGVRGIETDLGGPVRADRTEFTSAYITKRKRAVV
jgi:hypothetical protein